SGGTAATATGLAAGTYTVTITDANACTTTVTATITEPNVVQAPKVTSNSVSFKYGDSATALVATNDANHTLKWYEGDNKTLLTKAPIPITNKIGKQTYWVSQVNSTECESELVKIEVTITPATLTVTADAQSKVYGSVDSALTYQVTGIVNAEKESDVLSGNLSRDKGENVGSYLIDQGTLIANGNYTMTFAASNLTITPASLTVTADAQSKVYGSVDPALTYKVTGLMDAEKESDVLSGNLSRDKGENVGLYIINQGSLKASSNYTLDFKPNNLEITSAALTVKVDTQSKVYGSADPALTYQVTGLVDAEKESAVLSGNLSRDKGENVGSYLINQGTLIANGNYTMTFAGSNLTITPATLTVTADVQSKVYGSADPALTYKVTGLVNAEKESAVLSGNLSRDKGENVG
ncbi:MAG: MBG domain-containing protein, partial [Flavobacterium sp.]